MSLYSVLCELANMQNKIVGKGWGCADLLQFDLSKKDIKSRNKYIMKEGNVVKDEIELTNGKVYKIADIPLMEPEECLSGIDLIPELYIGYRDSAPSKRSNNSKCNFIAKRPDELTMGQLVSESARIPSQYKLEAYILLGSLMGIFKWENPAHWFWKSKDVPGLVLYRDWLI